MSDIEFSPPKHRNNLPLHIDYDLQYKEREPKCVNSLCNLINTRLKLLENEIVTQHKVWEYIQREVDEVKSLIEDCNSTCDSSSLSGQENDSEVVDSALESHKTCNSLLWDKIKQTEENVEEKKSLMQILTSDIHKLKSSKKKCRRRFEKANSNIDLILEVTNGLHVLKCDDCKFCREHIDFREGLLTSVIELIHFNEKKYNFCLDENKALKSCLQKIYMKTKRCLVHSQIYVKNTQLLAYENDNSSFCTESIYSSFEEFCQHFQNLQEELMQLKHILLAAEENHLDEVFQSSHSSDCRCHSYAKKGEPYLENDYEKGELKFPKSNEKNLCYYEKKVKILNSNNEAEHSDPEPVFEGNPIFSSMSNHEDKQQLEALRCRIFEAVKVIRDVEVVENDDENLINMVASLAEECSALRQEVSYLRNVRQEKKKAWNKLQCFIMDAERKLKGSNRNIPELRDVIRDLGHLIATSESSSLDETILYMYSNQLEWVEKSSMGCESPSYQVILCDGEETENHVATPNYHNNSTTCITAFTQTTNDFYFGKEHSQGIIEKVFYDIAIQTDCSSICSVDSSHPFESNFQEISREIYVVPEVLEEGDQSFNSTDHNNCQSENLIDIINDPISEIEMDCLSQNQKLSDNKLNCVSETGITTSIVPLSGRFPVKSTSLTEANFGPIVIQYPNAKSKPLFKMSDISFVFQDSLFHSEPNGKHSDRFLYLSGPLFLNSSANMKHFCNSMLHNMLKNYIKSIEICDQKNNLSCLVFKSKDFPSSLVSFDKCRRYLPYEFHKSTCEQGSSLVLSNSNYDIGGIANQNLYVCDDISAASVIVDFSILSSTTNEDLLPNGECDTININIASSNFSHTEEVQDEKIENPNSNIYKESESVCTDIDESDFNLEESDTSVQGKPAPACREGTFIIDSQDKVVVNKLETGEETLYHSVILTALMSNESRNSEKSYILYEIDTSTKSSMMSLQNINPFLVSNFDNENLSGQHFILCEAIEENIKSLATTPNVSCHIVFFKSNLKHSDTSCENPIDNISELYPLLPQYLPSENCHFDNFDSFSLAQSCEIYMCKRKNSNVDNEPEHSAYTPKNYFKFKEMFPVNPSNNNLLSKEKVLCQAVFRPNVSPNISRSYDENCDINLNLTKNHHEKDLSEITSQFNLVTKLFSSHSEKETQTDELNQLYFEENYFPLQSFSGEFQEQLLTSTEFEEHIVFEQKQNFYGYERERERKNPIIYNHSQDQALRETSLLDEIDALKDNLNQQNAVLLRLKEDLEESHFQLAEKEQLLVILQLENGRLNTKLTENDVREIDEKECQTNLSPNIYCEDLEKEVLVLRQKNLEHYEKIVHQNNTIQSVKSQLCATISHLKHLKDAATKQLKKQKHQIIKSAKLKQHLYETKAELERKCNELDKKNELLSDQEFHIQEMRVRLDSTIEELKEKSSSFETLDFGCQTDEVKISNFEESNDTYPQSKHDLTLRKHSEELMVLQTKFHHLELALSNKKEDKDLNGKIVIKTNEDVKSSPHVKEGNIWKLLTISEQSYLSLLNKLSEALQLSDLKGSSALMHSSWLSCDDLADARRHDHKKVLQSLEKLKRSIRYLQESLNLQNKRQNADNTPTDERKSNFSCHSEEMHFQYLCEVLQRAQESLVKDYSQKRSSSRTVVTAGSGRISRHTGSRERRIPLELKNGKILAVLDDKFNHTELLPNKFDYSKIECKAGNSKSKTS